MLLERLLMWFAWKLPRRLVYWTVVRATVHATTGPYSSVIAPDVRAQDVLERWRRPHATTTREEMQRV